MGRRNFLSALIIAAVCSRCLAPCFGASEPAERSDRTVASPRGDVVFQLLNRDHGSLQYKLAFGSETVIEPSRLGIVINGVDLGQGAFVEKIEPYDVNDRYPCRGVHSVASDRCRGA